jgi:dihydrolipoamide dehydrogenase
MSKNARTTDLLVIGGGPGGYAAAFRGSDLGMNVTLIESDTRLGGTCLLRGCIPSKALLHVAGLISESREAEKWGVHFDEPKIDLERLRAWKDSIVTRLSGGLSGLSKKRKVTVITGRASFKNNSTVSVEGSAEPSEIAFGHAIVATGSRPSTLPVFDIGSPNILNSTSALALEEIPERLLAVGGGIIGLELTTVYAELGSKVTLIEVTDGLVPGADRDLIRPLHKRLEAKVESLHLNTSVAAVEPSKKGLSVTFEGAIEDKNQEFDKILLSVGRQPNSENIGLENTDADLSERGHIQVDSQMRTRDRTIFAIGDVVEGPGLAHKAAHEGKVAAEAIAGHPSEFDGIIPSVVYTNPEVAWCGLTETQADREGRQVEVARFPWAASGRAATLGSPEGLSKLILDPETDRVLGVGIVGPNAGELIAEGVVAIEMAAVAEDLAGCIHPHPSLSESIGIAAEIHMGTATDLYIPKKK